MYPVPKESARILKVEHAAYTSRRFGRPGAFAMGSQRGITADETVATAKLRNYPNILLDVNDATKPAAFALLPLPYYRAAISWS